MRQKNIVIEILSYWHIGTGHGGGGAYDALTLKDADGLPYLPGRTLKGLLREGVQLTQDFRTASGESDAECSVEEMFGRAAADGEPDGSSPGALAFSNACLSADVRAWARTMPGASNTLYGPLSSTAIDDAGQADDRTLRTIEVCAPVTLTATVFGPDTPDWVSEISRGAKLVRSLGSHRNRGLGRCVMVITEGDNE